MAEIKDVSVPALIYICLACRTLHAWMREDKDHPTLPIKAVTRHIRSPGEDIWYCPKCGKEHRTFDGTFFGQPSKQWEEYKERKHGPLEEYSNSRRDPYLNPYLMRFYDHEL